MKLVTVLGARPQFVKAAALSRIIRQHNDVKEIIVHTGQHFDQNMSDIFFEEMNIPKPDYNLEINSLGHGAMTGRMLEKIEEVLLKEKPDIVLIYGDTNSTIAGALAAKKLHIKVAHVEAGLRSFNMAMPEEINRILTDRISDFLFCPTETAVKNLKNEGFENIKCVVENVGDVMYDAVLYYSKLSNSKSEIIQTLNLESNNYVVCTVHRQENTDDLSRMKKIVESLNKINKETRVILPLHPRTKKILQQNNIAFGFKTIEPVGYFDMIELLKNSCLLLTDSGGMQKEAYFFNKYCITLRDETEWTELIDNNVNFLAGPDFNSICGLYENLKNKKFESKGKLYGNGDACEKILSILGKNMN